MRTRRWQWMALGGAMGHLPWIAPGTARAQAPAEARVLEIEVAVDGAFRPARIEFAAGEQVRLRFIQRDDRGCAREVVFPSLALRRELLPGRRPSRSPPEPPARPPSSAAWA